MSTWKSWLLTTGLMIRSGANHTLPLKLLQWLYNTSTKLDSQHIWSYVYFVMPIPLWAPVLLLFASTNSSTSRQLKTNKISILLRQVGNSMTVNHTISRPLNIRRNCFKWSLSTPILSLVSLITKYFNSFFVINNVSK